MHDPIESGKKFPSAWQIAVLSIILSRSLLQTNSILSISRNVVVEGFGLGVEPTGVVGGLLQTTEISQFQ